MLRVRDGPNKTKHSALIRRSRRILRFFSPQLRCFKVVLIRKALRITAIRTSVTTGHRLPSFHHGRLYETDTAFASRGR